MQLVIGHYDVLALARKTLSEVLDDNVLGLASETAWAMFFGIFPALLFAAPLLSIVGDPQAVFRGVLDRVAPTMPPEAMGVVRSVLRDLVFARGAAGLMSIGALLALYAGAGMFSTLIGALNTAFDVRETRPWWRQKLVAIGVAAVSVIVVWISTAVLVAGQGIVLLAARILDLGPLGQTVWQLLQYPAALALLVAYVWMLYLVLPDVPDRPRAVRATLVGALVATFLWVVVTIALRAYIANFGSYNTTYGTIGGVIVLLTWMYWSNFAFLVGGELASEIRAGTGRDAAPARLRR